MMRVLLPGFKIRDLPGGTLELVVPKRYRTFSIILAVLMILLLVVIRAGLSTIILIPLMFAAGGLLTERWYFSRKAEEILHNTGTLMFSKTRRYDLKQVRYVEVIELTDIPGNILTDIPGNILPDPFKRKYICLAFVTVTETRVDIEVRPSEYKALLREKGQHIAEYLGKPFIER